MEKGPNPHPSACLLIRRSLQLRALSKSLTKADNVDGVLKALGQVELMVSLCQQLRMISFCSRFPGDGNKVDGVLKALGQMELMVCLSRHCSFSAV